MSETDQIRMRRIVQTMQDYLSTYTSQFSYRSYSEHTFINDMLYGIGISIDS